MKYIKVDDLRPGMILALTLYDNNLNTLLKANTKLTSFYISKIQTYDYDGLYVFENDDVCAHMDMISEETRIKAVKNLKHLNIDNCLYLANMILEEVKSNESMVIEMINLSSYDNYTYMHSINVDILSVVIGIGLGLTNDELYKLSQAAFLHDIGKTCIDNDLLNKIEKLTDEEYAEIQKHVLYGYNILKENENVSSVVRNVVYSHHENEDGSGYPRNLTGDKIHKFAKIIHIADVYEALTAKRAYKDAMNPSEAIEYLMANTGRMFDCTVVETFVKYIAPYPIGTTVELSNGEYATIVKNNLECLSRPVIMSSSGNLINLMKQLNITITRLM